MASRASSRLRPRRVSITTRENSSDVGDSGSSEKISVGALFGAHTDARKHGSVLLLIVPSETTAPCATLCTADPALAQKLKDDRAANGRLVASRPVFGKADLAAVGVKRPTTSWTMACTWGAEGSGELLDWLGVPGRHQVSRNSMLDSPSNDDKDLHGLVLLDLPDHDSTEVAHHVEVDRLVKLADLLVWVLDPQKYADAAIHDRYLRPLATHKEIMLVVLNHIDEVPEERRDSMVADLERAFAQIPIRQQVHLI